MIGDVREALVDTALERVRGRLAALRTDPSYPRELRRLVQEALDELSPEGAGSTSLLADPRDEELLCEALSDLGLGTPVSYELDCQGGLIAMSQDGRIVVTNTLESRLDRATPFLRSHLATLFEEKESEIRDVVHA
jgi:V/A-type H+-transporting ATPase subunit E